MKILIIKSDITTSLTLVNQILMLGHQVQISINAEDGYQKYLDYRPDLLISDVDLEGVDGLELAKKIRDKDKLSGIVLIAKQNEPWYLLATIEHGIKFLLEPVKEICIDKIFVLLNLEFENRTKAAKNSKLLTEYKKVVDASSIVSKTNTKGIITFVNDEFCKISGYQREELIGKNHNIVRHPNMPASAFKNLWETIKSKKIWRGSVENLKKDGDSYFVKATIVPVLDESDNIVEFIGLREDVTDLIEKEREIEKLNTQNLKTVADKAFSIKTSQLIRSIPTPLVAIDKDNNILQYNDEFHDLFNIDTANDFLTNLADNRANISDIINFEKDESLKWEGEGEPFDWKDEMITFGEELEISFKHENSERKFSLRIKEDKENTFIVAFA